MKRLLTACAALALAGCATPTGVEPGAALTGRDMRSTAMSMSMNIASLFVSAPTGVMS